MSRLRLREATGHTQPTQWGFYVERRDGDEWIPLIYDCQNKRHAVESLRTFACSTLLRNPRIVKRTVTPWEVSR